MAVRPIVRYPDPILKAVAEPVSAITDIVRRLIDDLVETMRASPATIGLAAPQIGVSSRCFVMDCTGHPRVERAHGLIALVDPRAEPAGGTTTTREGCLSVPDLTADVARPASVTLRGVGPDGGASELRLEGFEARVALHELDHLDGTLILDRAASPSSLFARKVYR